MTRLLISVRDVPEALLAARHGADFIDLKEPSAGALGGLPVETISAIVAVLREHGITLPVSATIGDLGMDRIPEIVARVHAVAACGVDYVKVGIAHQAGADAVLLALAETGWAVIPVFVADQGLDLAHVRLACALGFPGIMVDTADKRVGSLFDLMPEADVHQFLGIVRDSVGCKAGVAHRLAGVAGALRLAHLPALARLQPDFAGFRSAVCLRDRSAALDRACLEQLATWLREGAAEQPAQQLQLQMQAVTPQRRRA